MLNKCGREGGDRPYQGVHAPTYRTYEGPRRRSATVVRGIDQALARLDLRDGMTVSFHHHLRNGDRVLDRVMRALHDKGLKRLKVAASGLFPTHRVLVDLIADGTVHDIETAYIAGPLAHAVSAGALPGTIRMVTHGGRARAILEGECPIDVAFLAAPAADASGNLSGVLGPAACGSLGYAVADAMRADVVVAITDTLVSDTITTPDVAAGAVDMVVVVDSIGDRAGIVSGTTAVTKDPVGLRVAKAAATLIAASPYFRDGFSFQTGAGGMSLAVAAYVRDAMAKAGLVGAFGCGGITAAFVDMLETGRLRALYDVQAFDLKAVASSATHPNHHRISASTYANPNEKDHIASRLDVVVLGASEIDTDFHVNVTTGSTGLLLGGSGGHADTAAGASLSIIVSKLVNARVSCLVDRVTTITTPGETIDAFVTDRGVAINPRRRDLREALARVPDLEIVDMETLHRRALALTGVPETPPRGGRVIGYSVYRDGTILDTLYATP